MDMADMALFMDDSVIPQFLLVKSRGNCSTFLEPQHPVDLFIMSLLLLAGKKYITVRQTQIVGL
jgi:hypothetical protein